MAGHFASVPRAFWARQEQRLVDRLGPIHSIAAPSVAPVLAGEIALDRARIDHAQLAILTEHDRLERRVVVSTAWRAERQHGLTLVLGPRTAPADLAKAVMPGLPP